MGEHEGIDVVERDPPHVEDLLDREPGKGGVLDQRQPHPPRPLLVEVLLPVQPLLVDRGEKLAIFHQRRTGIERVVNSENLHAINHLAVP